ncbi:MAG: hypothetical protein Q8K78_06710 [Planctomycetaceae bacterium]|nr:hypothetical protein [Planctomycetaceae bacterium]
MTGRDLRSAWQSLSANSPITEPVAAAASGWWRCVGELLWGEQTPSGDVVRTLQHGPVASPTTCATATPAALMEALTEVPRGPQKTSVLTRLAQWWRTEFGDEESPVWRADHDHYRQSLRAIRGIGPETADRLILIAGGLPVFPIDRGTLRIAVRHGWLDLPVDDEQAQATFLSAFDSDVPVMQQASRVLKSIGVQHCGRVPDCPSCPLAAFLPETGPLHVEEC